MSRVQCNKYVRLTGEQVLFMVRDGYAIQVSFHSVLISLFLCLEFAPRFNSFASQISSKRITYCFSS